MFDAERQPSAFSPRTERCNTSCGVDSSCCLPRVFPTAEQKLEAGKFMRQFLDEVSKVEADFDEPAWNYLEGSIEARNLAIHELKHPDPEVVRNVIKLVVLRVREAGGNVASIPTRFFPSHQRISHDARPIFEVVNSSRRIELKAFESEKLELGAFLDPEWTVDEEGDHLEVWPGGGSLIVIERVPRRIDPVDILERMDRRVVVEWMAWHVWERIRQYREQFGEGPRVVVRPRRLSEGAASGSITRRVIRFRFSDGRKIVRAVSMRFVIGEPSFWVLSFAHQVDFRFRREILDFAMRSVRPLGGRERKTG